MSNLPKFDEKDFTFVGEDQDIHHDKAMPAKPFWKDVITRFSKNKGAVVGLLVIVIIILFAIFAPMLSNFAFDGVNTAHQNVPPRIPLLENLGICNGYSHGINLYQELDMGNIYHFFGTDTLGRDLWVRVWSGTRISLYVAAAAVFIDIFFGMGYGLVSGYFGGKVDTVLQRIQEVVYSIPSLVILTLLLMIMKPSLNTIIIALMLTGWVGMSRITRAEVLKIKEQEYILASKTLGASNFFILIKEIIPNIFGQIIIMSMFSIPNAIFYEAFLAFVGLGIPAPNASLGSLINEGYKSILSSPYMVIIPVIVLGVLMLSFNMMADGLRDAFDPKQKDH
ncbi:MAG: ABC transporter permease [Erysipelotrichaceae bacterium]